MSIDDNLKINNSPSSQDLQPSREEEKYTRRLFAWQIQSAKSPLKLGVPLCKMSPERQMIYLAYLHSAIYTQENYSN